MKKFLWPILIICFVWGGVAFAQDFASSTLTFSQPTDLAASTEYTFVFTVFNALPGPGDPPVAVRQIDIVLPTADYAYSDDQPAPPTPLHPDVVERWEATFDAASHTVTWQTFAMGSGEVVGDIREQESLTFSFVATTDATPTDGFAWTLTADDVANSTASGIWYFNELPDDDTGDNDTADDDAADDDNDTTAGDDDDSGGGGACGC